MRTYVFAMLKGGVRKTTSAVFTAFEMARRGLVVLVVDADQHTQGVVDWATRVIQSDQGLPFHVLQPNPRELLALEIRNKVSALAAEGIAVDVVIVDIGGEQLQTIRAAVVMADMVLLPTGTDQAEIGRLVATITEVPKTTRYGVLLTRVPSPGKGKALLVRRMLEADDHPVFISEIPQNREMYADPWGTVPMLTGMYGPLVDELDNIAGLPQWNGTPLWGDPAGWVGVTA